MMEPMQIFPLDCHITQVDIMISMVLAVYYVRIVANLDRIELLCGFK